MKTHNSSIQKKIKGLLDADQRDRANLRFRKYPDKKKWIIISALDKKRLEELERILEKQPIFRGIDYFRIGLLFQHGPTRESIAKAKKFAEKSFKYGYKKGRWLYAAATDRLLMMSRKRQKFGTQFRKQGGVWILHPVQRKTTDAERKKYNVQSLDNILNTLYRLNRETRNSRPPRPRIGMTRRK